MRKVIVAVLVNLLIYTSCAEENRMFPFAKGARKQFRAEMVEKWAKDNHFTIIYETTHTPIRKITTRRIRTDKGVFKCMTHLAKAYPDLSIPCVYCLRGVMLIRGREYQAHHQARHAGIRRKKMGKTKDAVVPCESIEESDFEESRSLPIIRPKLGSLEDLCAAAQSVMSSTSA